MQARGPNFHPHSVLFFQYRCSAPLEHYILCIFFYRSSVYLQSTVAFSQDVLRQPDLEFKKPGLPIRHSSRIPKTNGEPEDKLSPVLTRARRRTSVYVSSQKETQLHVIGELITSGESTPPAAKQRRSASAKNRTQKDKLPPVSKDKDKTSQKQSKSPGNRRKDPPSHTKKSPSPKTTRSVANKASPSKKNVSDTPMSKNKQVSAKSTKKTVESTQGSPAHSAKTLGRGCHLSPVARKRQKKPGTSRPLKQAKKPISPFTTPAEKPGECESPKAQKRKSYDSHDAILGKRSRKSPKKGANKESQAPVTPAMAQRKSSPGKSSSTTLTPIPSPAENTPGLKTQKDALKPQKFRTPSKALKVLGKTPSATSKTPKKAARFLGKVVKSPFRTVKIRKPKPAVVEVQDDSVVTSTPVRPLRSHSQKAPTVSEIRQPRTLKEISLEESTYATGDHVASMKSTSMTEDVEDIKFLSNMQTEGTASAWFGWCTIL